MNAARPCFRVVGFGTFPTIVESEITDCAHAAVSFEVEASVRLNFTASFFLSQCSRDLTLQGLLERNKISHNRLAGVWIKGHSNPILRGNEVAKTLPSWLKSRLNEIPCRFRMGWMLASSSSSTARCVTSSICVG